MDLQPLKKQLLQDLNKVSNSKELQDLKVKYLGKKGEITLLSKSLGKLSQQERPKAGKAINELRVLFESQSKALIERNESKEIEAILEKDSIDISLPSSEIQTGNLHPITKTINKICEFFSARGYLIEDGPEIESEYFNFDALNIPKDHPARDMHDTFYVDAETLLRTHTSPVQIRAINKRNVPLKIICPGKVYRSDADQTHTPMFHQIEGLLIDEKVSFGNLKQELTDFLNYFFEKDLKVRFRPSYFPFTEPSAEVDIMDKKGWLEIMGCGMVHPNVLKEAGVDPNKYSGFAFGLGIERMAKLDYEMEDMRLLFENDIRLISQS
jgi:phenylalanyl-tRNA synthetase alpha chain|tara:strand:- start:641 stop:1615 length:975 start_codon:yes stop_codon:yes gene_type:complete